MDEGTAWHYGATEEKNYYYVRGHLLLDCPCQGFDLTGILAGDKWKRNGGNALGVLLLHPGKSPS